MYKRPLWCHTLKTFGWSRKRLGKNLFLCFYNKWCFKFAFISVSLGLPKWYLFQQFFFWPKVSYSFKRMTLSSFVIHLTWLPDPLLPKSIICRFQVKLGDLNLTKQHFKFRERHTLTHTHDCYVWPGVTLRKKKYRMFLSTEALPGWIFHLMSFFYHKSVEEISLHQIWKKNVQNIIKDIYDNYIYQPVTSFSAPLTCPHAAGRLFGVLLDYSQPWELLDC